MNYGKGNLQLKMVELQTRAQEATTREERLKILAEATVLQQMIQFLEAKS